MYDAAAPAVPLLLAEVDLLHGDRGLSVLG